MAKKSAVNRNEMVKKLVKQFAGKREALKAIANNESLPLEERFEARLKVPVGKGIWPAFWTLGENITTKNWPHCGEIDIMEYLGHDTMTAYGTIHGPGYSGAEGKSKPFKLTSTPSFHDDFHTFAIEWSESEVLWFIDGQQRAISRRDDQWVPIVAGPEPHGEHDDRLDREDEEEYLDKDAAWMERGVGRGVAGGHL